MDRCAIYCRVSTDEQTVDNQAPVLTDLANRRGWEIAGIYTEEVSAWKAGHQAELAQLFEDARKGKFSYVLVWALDRLSREGSLAILQMIDRFKKYGVRVISYQEGWTEAPGELAEVMFAMVGWVAKNESQRRSERTKAGMARIKETGSRSGLPVGRPKKVRL